MNSVSDRVITSVIVLATVGVVAVAFHREFGSGPVPGRAPDSLPEFITDWRNMVPSGVLLGEPSARVTIVEFADLECPYCALLSTRLVALRKRYPRDVAVAFIHFPLAQHRFALPAARALECAGDQSAFDRFLELLYGKQDSLGLKPWDEFAREAGVSDLRKFDSCNKKTSPMPRVQAGLALGKEIGVRGTPVVILNGWRFARPPNDSVLSASVDSVLGGRKPFQLAVVHRREAKASAFSR